MTNFLVQIRSATREDAGAVCELASQLAQSFSFSRERFRDTYTALLSADDACLLLAADGDDVVGYLLAFEHATFFANGPVAWVEEILVRAEARGRGIGHALMRACEGWATQRECALVAVATRRAVPFYRAVGYQESATYLRKLLPTQTEQI